MGSEVGTWALSPSIAIRQQVSPLLYTSRQNNMLRGKAHSSRTWVLVTDLAAPSCVLMLGQCAQAQLPSTQGSSGGKGS